MGALAPAILGQSICHRPLEPSILGQSITVSTRNSKVLNTPLNMKQEFAIKPMIKAQRVNANTSYYLFT